jgi:hypothetical protein
VHVSCLGHYNRDTQVAGCIQLPIILYINICVEQETSKLVIKLLTSYDSIGFIFLYSQNNFRTCHNRINM